MTTRNDNPSGNHLNAIKDNVGAIKRNVRDGVRELVDSGSERASALKSRVGDVKDQAVHRGNALVERSCELIKAHPLKAVGVAFAAGFVGMRLLRRR